MKYEIDEQLVNALVGYLAGQPYASVVNMINALQTLPKIAPIEPPAGNGQPPVDPAG